MQAALTGLDNRHKAAAARAEKALEAAARELRAEAAAAQKAESRRLEAMLQHSTSLLRQTSVLGLATARATLVNDIESLRGEVILTNPSVSKAASCRHCEASVVCTRLEAGKQLSLAQMHCLSK